MENEGIFIRLNKYQNETEESILFRRTIIVKNINKENIEKYSRMLAYNKFLGIKYSNKIQDELNSLL